MNLADYADPKCRRCFMRYHEHRFDYSKSPALRLPSHKASELLEGEEQHYTLVSYPRIYCQDGYRVDDGWASKNY